MNLAFDVDGTLIGSVRSDRPRPGAAALLAALHDRGHTVVLWSAGGAEYADRKATEHGLAAFVAATYPKAVRGADGRYRVDHFAPEHAPDAFVDDAPGDVPAGRPVICVVQFLGGNDADTGLAAVLAEVDRRVAEVGR